MVSILSKPSEAVGQHFLGAAGWYTIDDICAIFAKVTDKQILFQQVSESAFAATNGEEVCEAWVLLRDYSYFGLNAKVRLQASLEVSQPLIPSQRCFANHSYCDFSFLVNSPRLWNSILLIHHHGSCSHNHGRDSRSRSRSIAQLMMLQVYLLPLLFLPRD